MGKHSRKKISAFLLLIMALFAGAFFIFRRPVHPVKVIQKTYFAMGDSVAAGTGLETNSDSSACDRTNESYPNLIAKQLNLKLENVACSGASISAGITGRQVVNNATLDPQLTKLSGLEQKPTLITLTIGANDISWNSFINECYTSECGTPADTASLATKLADYKIKLTDVLTKIGSKYIQSPPHVIVTSYYRVFPAPGTNCTLLSSITPTEQNWWQNQEKTFDEAISNSVKSFPYASFAAVDFSGHELCTKDSWIQDITTKVPIHPNDKGQAAIARAVANAFAKL